MVKKRKVKKKAEAKKPEERTFPLGIKIISISTYILSGIFVLLGILFVFYGIKFSDLLIENVGEMGPAMVIVAGVLFLLLGFLGLFIGRGLWKRHEWARIAAVIVLCLSIVSSVYNLIYGGAIISNAIWIVLAGVVGAYLAFNKKVKKAFHK